MTIETSFWTNVTLIIMALIIAGGREISIRMEKE
jgi:hypothetical protein